MKRVQLTEAQLHEVIKESVMRVLRENAEDEGLWGNAVNAAKTAWRTKANMPGDGLQAGFNKFRKLQSMDKNINQYNKAYNQNGFGQVADIQSQIASLQKDIQEKEKTLQDLNQQLASANSNGQMSRNMANLRRGMGGDNYNMSRTAYKNGLDANHYDQMYGQQEA